MSRSRSRPHQPGALLVAAVLGYCCILPRAAAAAAAVDAAACGSTGCPAALRPVCGADGRSYSNACVASCAGTSVQHEGYCEGEGVGDAVAHSWPQCG
jgi:hypothetical protein